MAQLDPQYVKIMDKLITADNPGYVGKVRHDDFGEDFIFGSATSAYQFEGAAEVEGKGPSVWDHWTHNRPDKVRDGSNGKVACNQYHLYKDDIQLMKKTGLESYRFSISWPRILPGGKLNAGINDEGIKYYNDLIDSLLAEGIEPCATLFHWDIPLTLEQEYGGFLSRDVIKDFCEFAELCFWEFGDRVKSWITFNEGWTYCNFGYVAGTFPPGHGIARCDDNAKYRICAYKGAGVPTTCSRGDPAREPYLAAHNMLLAHAYAVDLYRKKFQENQGGKIGITNNCHFFEPLNDTVEDKNASIRAIDWMFGWFTAPVATGDYPPNMRQRVGNRLPKFSPEETKLIKGSYDFVGLNYYTTWYATYTPKEPCDPITYLSDQELTTSTARNNVPIGDPTGTTWLWIVPRGIYNTLMYMKEIYNINLVYITENGMAELNDASLTISKAREDPVRVRYYNDHIWYMQRAIREAGVNVKAYYLWSFGDNFEWADGYTARFGIFYVDFMNGRVTRYPKTSAIWWRNFFTKKHRRVSLKREATENENESSSDVQKRPRAADNMIMN